PYSHALENELIHGIHHEAISLLIMQTLNEEYDQQLQTAIEIFTDTYPKHFLHQLVSGQLDVDRMDYLSRDSFFTGVSEGVISYDRILKMLVVKNDELMIEEKGIYSIEKFLVARRLMYWQVYLNKTVKSDEMLLVKIIRRAKELIEKNIPATAATESLNFFLNNSGEHQFIKQHLDKFCNLDDYDVMCTIKNWSTHADKILATLCRSLVDRRLLKIKLQTDPFDEKVIQEKRCEVAKCLQINEKETN